MPSKSLIHLIAVSSIIILAACNTQTPEKYFDVAVLNTNMLVGFANGSMERELASPSVKMGETKNDIVTMTRTEIVESKMNFINDNYQKLKSFSPSGEEKEIVQQSMALHELVLGSYQKAYRKLANLYDEKADASTIEKLKSALHEKYGATFETLYNRLISSGKHYAQLKNITVNWAL